MKYSLKMLLAALDWILRYPIDSFFFIFIFEDICACPLIEVSFFPLSIRLIQEFLLFMLVLVRLC